jgi:hypothetical protein
MQARDGVAPFVGQRVQLAETGRHFGQVLGVVIIAPG